MKKSELIKKLNDISSEDYDIVVVDWGKNLNADSHGDGSGVGMYSDFGVHIEENVNEDHPDSHFISLTIDNDDYNLDGISVADELMKALIEIDDVSPEEIGQEAAIMKIRSITNEAIEYANDFNIKK